MITLPFKLITKPSETLLLIHEKYGEFHHTRFINKDVVFVSNYDDIKEIFNLEAKGLINRDTLYSAKKPIFGDSIMNSKGEVWKNQRRLMQPFFNKDYLFHWQIVVEEECHWLVEQIHACVGKEVNISYYFKVTVQRIIIRLLFGEIKNNQAQNDLLKSIDILGKGFLRHVVTATLGAEQLKHLFWLQNVRSEKALSQFVSFVNQQIETGHNAGKENSLVSLLISADGNNSGYKISKELLKDELLTLFLAGQDTTINTLIWFFYNVANDPNFFETICLEVNSNSKDEINVDTIANHLYTRASLYETLRLFPQAVAVNRNAAEDIEINNKKVKKNSTIIINIFAMHHDENIWVDHKSFKPDRFISDEGSLRSHDSYMPFGGGMHNCIGRHLAEMEMLFIIINVLRKYSVKTLNHIQVKASSTLKPNQDLFVTLIKKT